MPPFFYRILGSLFCSALAFSEDLAPGLHADLSPAGHAEYSYSIYIPKKYAEDPAARFPVVYCADKGGIPGNNLLKDWADDRSVIIATINDTVHDTENDPAKIKSIQDAVLPAIDASIRGHHCLRFSAPACWTSMAGMQLITREPDHFAGLLMITHNAFGFQFPRHLCVALVFANQDQYITPQVRRDTIDFFRKQSVHLKIVERDGLHSETNKAEVVGLLDWMLDYQRICHPKLTQDEIKDGFKLVQAKLSELEAADQTTQAMEYAALLDIERVAKAPEFKDLKSRWFAAASSAADAETDPVAKHRALVAIGSSPHAAGVLSGKAKADFDRKLKELRAQKPVKADWESQQALDAVRKQEEKAGTARGKLIEIGTAYAQISAKYPDTDAGKQAKIEAERIQAALNK